MPYTARFSKIFLKKYSQLPSAVKSRLTELIRGILVNPYNATMLVGSLKGLWKVRAGKYRIVFEIDAYKKIVTFHDVDLRKKVYK